MVCVSAGGNSPIPAADQQALRDNLLEGLIRQAYMRNALVVNMSSTPLAKVSVLFIHQCLNSLALPSTLNKFQPPDVA